MRSQRRHVQPSEKKNIQSNTKDLYTDVDHALLSSCSTKLRE